MAWLGPDRRAAALIGGFEETHRGLNMAPVSKGTTTDRGQSTVTITYCYPVDIDNEDTYIQQLKDWFPTLGVRSFVESGMAHKEFTVPFGDIDDPDVDVAESDVVSMTASPPRSRRRMAIEHEQPRSPHRTRTSRDDAAESFPSSPSRTRTRVHHGPGDREESREQPHSAPEKAAPRQSWSCYAVAPLVAIAAVVAAVAAGILELKDI